MTTDSLKQHLHKSLGHNKWLLHVLFWAIMLGIFYQQTRAEHAGEGFGYPESVNFYIFCVKSVLLLFLSYGFQFAVIPLYTYRRKYIFWLAFLGLMLLSFGLRVMFVRFIILDLPASGPESQPLIAILYRNWSGTLFPFIFFIAFYYFIDIHDQQKEIQRLTQFKTQKIALESSFLKSQVNPHFLFNTLNNIYALSLKRSAQTPVIIEKLELLLHYMLYECQADLVPLENEFIFTNSYIALEKLRHKEDQCIVNVNVEGSPEGKMIAPLLLINFLENAFKHGTKTSFGKSWINLDVKVHDQEINFRLQNSKPLHTIGQAIEDYQGGIGLKNVKRRLEILYPNKHSLMMNNLKDRFEISLIIEF